LDEFAAGFYLSAKSSRGLLTLLVPVHGGSGNRLGGTCFPR
jgi:hypothetical protein